MGWRVWNDAAAVQALLTWKKTIWYAGRVAAAEKSRNKVEMK